MSGNKGIYRNLTLITQISLYVMVPIFLCTGIGIWLENKTGLPLTIVFLIIGILSGARTGYVSVMEIIRSDEKEEKKKQLEEIERKVSKYGKT